jgi:hypothetical protein
MMDCWHRRFARANARGSCWAGSGPSHLRHDPGWHYRVDRDSSATQLHQGASKAFNLAWGIRFGRSGWGRRMPI